MTASVTITLSTIPIFIRIVSACSKSVNTVDTVLSFSKDIQNLLADLERQALRLRLLVGEQPLSAEKIIDNTQNFEAVKRRLDKIQDYFETCGALIEKYGADNALAVASSNKTPEPALPPAVARSITQPQVSSSSSASAPISAQSKQTTSAWKRAWMQKRKEVVNTEDRRVQHNSSTGAPDGPAVPVAPYTQGLTMSHNSTAASLRSGVDQFYQRMVSKRWEWTAADRDILQDNISRICIGNDDLDRILKSLAPLAQSWELPTSAETDRFLASNSHENTARVLNDLHHALVKANRKGRKPFFMTMKMVETPDQLRDELNHKFDLEVPNASDVFYLRRHLTSSFEDDGHLFVVECDERMNRADDLKLVDSLDFDPSNKMYSNWDNLARLGYLKRTTIPHVIYSMLESAQECPTTLEDLLRDERYKKEMLPIHIVQLSRLLLYTHLYLLEHPSADVGFQPSDLRYYCSAAQAASWDLKDPPILGPWLAIGLGSRPSAASLGQNSGTTPSQDYVLAKLGLLLCQLGLGTNFDYSRTIAMLKVEALSKMEKLQSRMGLTFAKLVRRLLEHVDVRKRLATEEDLAKALGIIKNCISTLSAIEVEMEGTISHNLLDLFHQLEARVAKSEQNDTTLVPQQMDAAPSMRFDTSSSKAHSIRTTEAITTEADYGPLRLPKAQTMSLERPKVSGASHKQATHSTEPDGGVVRMSQGDRRSTLV